MRFKNISSHDLAAMIDAERFEYERDAPRILGNNGRPPSYLRKLWRARIRRMEHELARR